MGSVAGRPGSEPRLASPLTGSRQPVYKDVAAENGYAHEADRSSKGRTSRCDDEAQDAEDQESFFCPGGSPQHEGVLWLSLVRSGCPWPRDRRPAETVGDLKPHILNDQCPVDLNAVRQRQTRRDEILAAYKERLAQIAAKQRRPYAAIALSLIATTMLYLLPATFNDTPWLPAERITVSNEITVGYVVNVGQEWTTVLVDNTRLVRLFPTTQVQSRTICQASQRMVAPHTVYHVLGLANAAAPKYPKC